MDLYIGENIKRLRREKGVTQEKLAEHLGISTQAVSKWERGETLPDITLVIPLASYFGISTDELLGLDEAKNKARAEEMLKEYRSLKDNYKLDEAKAVIEEAYRKFPNNWSVVLRYLWNLIGTSAHSDKSRILEHDAEIEDIVRRIQEDCTVDSYRFYALNAKANLALARGEQDKALEILSAIPRYHESRQQRIEWLYPTDSPEYHRQLHLNIAQLAELTVIKIGAAIWNTPAPLDEKIPKALSLAHWVKEIITETGYTIGCKALGGVYMNLARHCAEENRYDEAVKYLSEMEKYYEMFDKCYADNEPVPGVPEGVVSHILDDWTLNGTCNETAFRWFKANPDLVHLQSREDFADLCRRYTEEN